jgi:hypothetical protein
MFLPPNVELIRTILNWYGVIGVLTAPLVMMYYLYRLNHSDNPWKFADMLMTKNREGIEKADLSKFGIMIALITSAAAVVYMAVNHADTANFAAVFITFISVFSGVQVANGALRVWDNSQQKTIITTKDL